LPALPEGLQVAEVVGTAVVPGHDVVHLLAALLAEGVEALVAQGQQLVALGVAQLLAAHQGLGAPLAAVDAVEGEPYPPCAPQDPAGHVLRRRW
jgi:hypothetical protein